MAQVDQAFEGGPHALRAAVAECWREAESVEERWLSRMRLGRSAGASAYAKSWSRLNHVAGLPRT
jgi:hypothetical protein